MRISDRLMLQGVVLVGGLGDVRLGGEGGRERGAHRGADSVVAGRGGHHGLGVNCAEKRVGDAIGQIDFINRFLNPKTTNQPIQRTMIMTPFEPF